MSDLKSQISAIVQSCQPKARRIVHGSARDVPRVAWDPKFPKPEQEPKRAKGKPSAEPVAQVQSITPQQYRAQMTHAGSSRAVQAKGYDGQLLYLANGAPQMIGYSDRERRRLEGEAILAFTGSYNPAQHGVELLRAEAMYNVKTREYVPELDRSIASTYTPGNAADVAAAKQMARIGALRRDMDHAIRQNDVDKVQQLKTELLREDLRLDELTGRRGQGR